MFSFSSRLESSLQGWPPAVTRDLRTYIRRFQCGSSCRSEHVDGTRSLPYWLLLPDWLATAYNTRRGTPDKISRPILNDILWGQYCIFLSVRIKDDLFDKQATSSRLLFAADRFQTEAFDILFRRSRRSGRFRGVFTSALTETLRSIMDVDAMQRRIRVPLKTVRAGHARVSSIFKLGSAAVCCASDRWPDYNAISKACDALAIAGQIVDDFQDIDEDIRDGRLNYASRFLLGASNRTGPRSDKARRRIAERLLHSDRTDRLIDEIISHVRAAHQALSPLGLKEAGPFFDEYMRSLKHMASVLSRERIRRLFDLDRSGRVKNTRETK